MAKKDNSNQGFQIFVEAQLNKTVSTKNINKNLKEIQKDLNKIKVVAELNIGETKQLINASIGKIQGQLKKLKLNIAIQDDIKGVLNKFSNAVNKLNQMQLKNMEKFSAKQAESYAKLEAKVKEMGQKMEAEKASHAQKLQQAEESHKLKMGEMQQKIDSQKEKAQQELQQKEESHEQKMQQMREKHQQQIENRQNKQKNQQQSQQASQQQQTGGNPFIPKNTYKETEFLNGAGNTTGYQYVQKENNGYRDIITNTDANNIQQSQKIIENIGKQKEDVAKLRHEVKQFKDNATIDYVKTQETLGKFIDPKALDGWLKSVESISDKTPNAKQAMQSLNTQFRQITTDAKLLKDATSSQDKFLAYQQQFSAKLRKLRENGFVDTKSIDKVKSAFNTLKQDSKVSRFQGVESQLKDLQNLESNIKKVKLAQDAFSDSIKRMRREGVIPKNMIDGMEKMANQLSPTSKHLAMDIQKINQYQKDMKQKRAEILKESKETEQQLNRIKGLQTKIVDQKTGVKSESTIGRVKLAYDAVEKKILDVQKAGRNLSDSEVAQINRVIEALDRRIAKQKNLEKETIRLGRLGTQVGTATGNLDASAVSNIKSQVAQLYSQQLNKNVKASDVTIQSKIDPQTLKMVHDYVVKIKEGKNETVSYKGSVDQATRSIRQLGDATRTTAQRNLTFWNGLESAMQKIPIWMAGMTVFMQSLRFFTEGVTYINDLNKAMTEISIVTMKSQEEMDRLAMKYHDMANEMSVATKEIATASVEFYRQGLNQAEVMERTVVATQYAKISNLDFAKSAKIITAATNSMGVSAERASDVFSYLGDATASGADEVGEAMQRVGGSAGALNIEFEKVSSWATVISSKTRESAYTIGNSIKSILARIQSMKENGFDEEDGTQVNQVAQSLASVGVALMDSQGQFRNFGTVMDELGSRWKNLDSRQKAYIATTVAGSYQQSRFLNLMEDYEQSIDLYEGALNSAGTTTQKFNLYQKGTEATLNRLHNAMTGVWQKTFDSQGLRQLIQGLTDLVNMLGWLIDKFGAVTVGAELLFLAFIAFNGSVRTFVKGHGASLVAWCKNVVTHFRAVATGATETNAKLLAIGMGARVASISLATLTRGLKALGVFLAGTFLPIVAIMAVSWAIDKVTASIQKNKQEIEEWNQITKEMSTNYLSHSEKIKELKNEYDRLSEAQAKGQVLSEEDQQKLVDVQNALARLLPTLTKEYDANGNAILKRSKALEAEMNFIKDTANKKYLEDRKNLEQQINDKLTERIEKAKELKKIEQKLSESKKAEEKVNPNYYTNLGMTKSGVVPNTNPTYSLNLGSALLSQEEIGKLKVQKEKALKILGEYEGDINTIIQGIIRSFQSINNIQLDESLDGILMNLIGNLDLDGKTAKQINDMTKGLEDFVRTMGSLKEVKLSGNVEKYKKAFEELAKVVGKDAENAFEAFVKASEEQEKGMVSALMTLEKMKESFEESNKHIDEVESNLGSLAGAYQTIKDGEKLDPSTLLDLIRNHKELAEYIGKTGDATFKNGEIIKQVFDIRKKIAVAEIKLEQDKLKTELEMLSTKLEAEKQMWDTWAWYTFGNVEELSGKIEEVQKRLNILESTGKAISGLNINSWAGKGKEKDIDLLEELNEKLEEYDLLIKQSEYAMSKYNKGSEAYRKELRRQIELLKTKKQLMLDELKNLRSQQALNGKTTTTSTTTKTTPSKKATVKASGIDYSPTKNSSVDTSKISSMIGPLGKYAEQIVKSSVANSVDPALIAAIIRQEVITNGGKSTSNIFNHTNNVGNIRAIGKQPRYKGFRKFGSVEEGIDALTGLIHRYIQRGLNTIDKIGNEYAPLSDGAINSHWIPGVIKNMKKMGVDIDGNVKMTTTSTPAITTATPTVATTEEKTVTVNVEGNAEEMLKKIDDAEDELKNNVIDIDIKIDDLEFQEILDRIDEFEIQADDAQEELSLLEKQLERNAEGTLEYELALNSQVRQMDVIKEKTAKAIQQAKEELKNDKLSVEQKAEIERRIVSLIGKMVDLQNAQDDLRFRALTNDLKQFEENMSDLDFAMSMSQARMESLDETTKEYGTEMLLQQNILRQQIALEQEHQKALQAKMNTVGLTIEQYQDLNRQLQQSMLAQANYQAEMARYNREIKQKQEELADQIVDAYKDAYEAMKKEALKEIEEREKAEEKAHEERLDRIDEEADRFKEFIDEKMKLIDEEENKESYDRDLEDLQTDRQKLQNKINALSMDDSVEAKAQVKELLEELADIDEEIEVLKNDRSRELRRENLEETLDDYEKDVEAKKKAEDQKYEDTKESLEKQKTDIEEHYDKLINDERRWAELKKQITNATIEELKVIFGEFESFINQNSKNMGDDVRDNFIYQLQEAKRLLEQIQGMKSPSSPITTSATTSANPIDYGNNGQGSTNQSTNEIMTKLKSDKNYALQQKERTMGIIENRRSAGMSTEIQEKFLDTVNSILRDYHGVYHKGGIFGGVMDEDSKLLNSLLNEKLSSKEGFAKLLKGEVIANPKIAIPNLIANLSQFLGKQQSPTPNIIQINELIRIDNVTKDANINIKQLVKDATNELMRQMKPYGFI